MVEFKLTTVQTLAYRLGYASVNGARGIRFEVMTVDAGVMYELAGASGGEGGEGKFLLHYPESGEVAVKVTWVSEDRSGEVVGEITWSRLAEVLRDAGLPVSWRLYIPEAADLLKRWFRNPLNRAFVEYGTPAGCQPDFARLPALMRGVHWLLYHQADRIIVWVDLPGVVYCVGRMHQGEPFVWALPGGCAKPAELAELADPPGDAIVIGRADYLRFAEPEAWDATDR